MHGEEGLEQLGDFFDRRDLGNFRLIERLMTEVDRVRDIAQLDTQLTHKSPPPEPQWFWVVRDSSILDLQS